MEKNCVICSKMTKVFTGVYSCVKRGCYRNPHYCIPCAKRHILEIRCPRHFLKSHREDVARHKKEVSK